MDKNILKNVDKIVISNRWNINTDFEKLINYILQYNKNMILVGNGQTFYDIPTLFFKKNENINLSLKNLNKNLLIQNDKMKKLAIKNQIQFFNRSILNCNPECIAYENSKLLYSDKDHWSYFGLKYFSDKIFHYDFGKILK